MTATSVATWQGILQNQKTLMSRNANSAAVKNALAYFNKKAPLVSKVDDLLKDRKLLNTLLTTYGLEGEINNIGKLKQLLTQDPKDPKSLVNRLVDPRYTKFVVDLSFSGGTPAALKDPKFQDKVAQTYTLNTFETGLGNQDTAVREAAYFMRNIGNVTDVYQILADKVLTDVVVNALGLSAGFRNLDVDKQAALLKSRLNLKDLQSVLGSNAGLFQSAADDQVKITDTTNLSNKASAVVKDLMAGLGNIEDLYKALGARQDPLGVNAAKIGQQNTYVGQLAYVRGLLDSATSRTSDLVSGIDHLTQLAGQVATTSAANMQALRDDFDATVARLKTNIDNATYIDPVSGNPKSLLTDSSLSISIGIPPSSTFTFNGTDISSVKSLLDTAQTQFDGMSAGATAPAGLLSDLTSARSSSVAGTDFLALQAQKYGQALNTVNSNISPFEQQMISRADSSVTDSVSRAKQISSKLISLQSALEAAQSGTGNRSLIDADVQKLKADLETLVRGNPSSTDNLLTGNAGYGSVQGLPLEIKGGDFLNDIVAKLKDVNAFSVDGAKKGATLISETLRPLVTSTINKLQAQGAYVQSTAGSANFAITPDTAQLRLGSQSASDALDRATQIGVLLGQIRSLATAASKAGNGSKEVDEFGVKASDLIQQVNKLITTQGAGLDNLLVGGAQHAYNFLPGTQLHIKAGDLGNTISTALAGIDLSTPGSTSAVDAAVAAINGVLPNLTDVKASLSSGLKTIDTARKSFDPRAPIDDLFAATVANISTQVAGATVNGKNLLNNAADQLLFLKSTPSTYTVSGHSEFDMQITRGLQDAVKQLLSNATLPTTVIHQSILALNSVNVDLTGDVTVLTHGTRNVNTLLEQKAKAEADQALSPYQGTRKAKQLANQFLALNQGDGGQVTLGSSLAQMLGGNSSSTNILNLLI